MHYTQFRKCVSSDVVITSLYLFISAVPGPPENITLLSRSSNSLRVQIKLSLIGSSPLLSAHLLLRESQSESTALPLYYNITKDLQRGGRVVFDVGGLLPDTSYSVVIYATNAAGKGVDSRNKIFKTSESR